MKKFENTKYLGKINGVEDLRKLSLEELPAYCKELREFIIESVASNPGHLGSSLGALELAVALHYVYDTPEDRVVWDVGHQAYAHKIITGRRDVFDTNRTKGGISGFPKRGESEFDCFGGGHASVSVSAAVGMAASAEIKGEHKHIVAVIGDGALTGGLAFEGLNNAREHNLLVILNDNNMSIDPNVGGLNEYLTRLTTSKRYNRLKTQTWKTLGFWPQFRKFLKKILDGAKSFFMQRSNLFESLGFRYFGPTDGNDVIKLVKRLRDLKEIEGAKLLHILTTKGKGYDIAEREQTIWHAPGKFDVETGKQSSVRTSLRYQEIFGYTLKELAESDDRIVGVTPAMPTGSSLNILMEAMPHRAFDVGIAEGHAVTFSAGMAVEGMIPFCNIYSSFAQRSVDNIIHDVALQGVDVVLCLDRAGLVGEDGATHHGVFDIALLRSIPGIIISAPSSAEELRNIMYTASKGGRGCCFVIRYPRGGHFPKEVLSVPLKEVEVGKSVVVSEPTDAKVAILSLGATYNIAKSAAEELGAAFVDLRFAKPLDTSMLDGVAAKYNRVVVVEDGVVDGGVGSAIRDYYAAKDINIEVRSVGVGDSFVEHASVGELWESVGLTSKNIVSVASK